MVCENLILEFCSFYASIGKWFLLETFVVLLKKSAWKRNYLKVYFIGYIMLPIYVIQDDTLVLCQVCQD